MKTIIKFGSLTFILLALPLLGLSTTQKPGCHINLVNKSSKSFQLAHSTLKFPKVKPGETVKLHIPCMLKSFTPVGLQDGQPYRAKAPTTRLAGTTFTFPHDFYKMPVSSCTCTIGVARVGDKCFPCH